MKKLKLFKGLALSAFVGITAISLVACGTTGQTGTHSFTRYPINYLEANNSPLNGTFQNSPTSTYAQTQLYSLTGYQTTGQFVTNQNGTFEQTTKDTLILEAASAVVVFANEDVMKDVDAILGNSLIADNSVKQEEILQNLKNIKTSIDKKTTTPSEGDDVKQETNADETSTDDTDTTSKWNEGTDYWIFTRDKGGIQFQKGLDQEPDTNISEYYNNAMSKGKVYQFVIDTDNWWVDGTGAKQINVSSKDFERGLETYALASAIGYTRNSYFLDLIGLGEQSLGKTVSYKDNNQYVNPSVQDYNIDDFANKNDAVYTMYIDEPYPYALDLISKEYFGPLPHTNQKVKNISLKSGKISLDNNGKIDNGKTKFNEIFGSGSLGVFTEGTWYAGAYYVSAFTSNQIIFNLNHTYMDVIGDKYLLSYVDGKPLSNNNKNTDSRMEQVVITFGSGSDDTYFENFKAGQIDYLASVPEAKRNEANNLRSSIVPTKIIQTTRSNYIAYTPNPYIVDAKGNVTENNYLSNMAQFIYQWDNKDSMIIRAGITGLVNYYRLADMVYSDSKDFQLSATPYGAFKNYYESVAKGNLYGALPRPYSDYKDTKEDILGEFEMSFYSYDTDTSTVKIEKEKINQQTFQNAVKNVAKNNGPLNFNIKFGDGPWSTNYKNFYFNLGKTIESLSGNNISVSLIEVGGPNPTKDEWYNNQSSPLGYSYWSPDYNGVGTWIEADNTLENVKVGETTYEGVPGTNAHNAFHTFLTSMVYAVKLMNYTWNSSTNKYEANTTSSDTTQQTTGDPYANDIKVQKAFSDNTLTDLGINTNDSSFNNKNTPGEKYGTLAIELLNLLIEKNVFDQSKFDAYVTDPSKLLYANNKPTDIQNLYLGGDVIKAGQSANFSKYLGVFAGQSTAKALYENTVLDSDYSFIPRAEAGLNERIITLVNPDYVARSGTQSINWRDFGVKNK